MNDYDRDLKSSVAFVRCRGNTNPHTHSQNENCYATPKKMDIARCARSSINGYFELS